MTPERIAQLREWNKGGADECDEMLDTIDKLRAELDQTKRSLVVSEEQLRVQTEDSKIKQREIYRLELAIHKLMDEPDFEAMVKKWCVCAEDYTLRGRTDPYCRCDVWQEAIEEAYEQGKRDGYIKGSDDMGNVVVQPEEANK